LAERDEKFDKWINIVRARCTYSMTMTCKCESASWFEVWRNYEICWTASADQPR